VGLEGGLLSLMSTIEELLGRNSSSSGLENQEYSHGDLFQKLVLTSPTSSGLSASIFCLRTKATEFVCLLFCSNIVRLPIYSLEYLFSGRVTT
jgi:hypothetical protein